MKESKTPIITEKQEHSPDQNMLEACNDSGLLQLHKLIDSLITGKSFQLLAMRSNLIVITVLHKT